MREVDGATPPAAMLAAPAGADVEHAGILAEQAQPVKDFILMSRALFQLRALAQRDSIRRRLQVPKWDRIVAQNTLYFKITTPLELCLYTFSGNAE
jgi:hypothetical protein